MRNAKGQFVMGASGNPAGRPRRAEEQVLVDLWTKHGQKAFSEAVQKRERWALKLLVDKLYPNKRESVPVSEFAPPSIYIAAPKAK